MNHPRTAEPAVTTIARLNDEFRSTFEAGKVFMTAAVNALPVDDDRLPSSHYRRSLSSRRTVIQTKSTTLAASRSSARRSSGRSIITTRPARMVPRIRAIPTKRRAY
jgi:hypothetical protein